MKQVKKMGVPVILFTAALFAAGCGEQNNQETETLRAQNQTLRQELVDREQSVSDFMGTFNEIEDNLLTIQNKERKIVAGEISGGNVKQRISAEIEDINRLLRHNKQLVASLEEKMKQSGSRITAFEKSIERLNAVIQSKDVEIAMLNEQLQTYNYRVEVLARSGDSLRAEIMAKANTIEQKDNELNEVYYVVGTKRELIKAGVLNRKGEFSGRPGLKLNYTTSAFKPADARELEQISLSGKRAKVLTGHPTGSFELANQKLVIKDADDFWKANNYCVVQVN